MNISDEGLRKLQAIWKADYGEEISFDKAREIGSRLVELYALLLKAKREHQK